MAIIATLFRTAFSFFSSNPHLILVAIFLCILTILVYKLGFSESGPNPFAEDGRRPPEPLLVDQNARDKIIKQGFTANKVPEDLDAVVIGSGIGGLSCAAILAKAGKKVLVLEQHDQSGGCCHTFHDKGFEFDTGIHYIGKMVGDNPDKFFIDQITEGQLQWSPLEDDYDHVLLGDLSNPKTFPIWHSKDGFRRGLLEKFPEEGEAIDKLLDLLKTVRKNSFGFVILKVLPLWLSKFLIYTGLYKLMTSFFKYSQRSLTEVVSELTDNKDLRAVFSYCFGDYGSLPKDGSFAFHCFLLNHFMHHGAFYPVGGASEISRHIIPVIEKAGGKVLVRAPVSQILLNSDKTIKGVRVKKSSGDVDIVAPVVISDAGIYNTYERLLPKDVTGKIDSPLNLSSVQHGLGAISVFVGLHGTKEELGLSARNWWAFTSNEVDKICTEFLEDDADQAGKNDIPILFFSFPSAKDPSWEERFPGKSTCTLITLANYDWFKEWNEEKIMKRGAPYMELKERIGRRMWEMVCRKFPQLKNRVDFFEIGSPLSNNYYLGSNRGEIYGIDHNKERFGPETLATLRPQTSLPGLYLTGQDIFSCGFTGALFGGLFAASAVLKRNCYMDLERLTKRCRKSK